MMAMDLKLQLEEQKNINLLLCKIIFALKPDYVTSKRKKQHNLLLASEKLNS